MSPTARTLQYLKKNGVTAQVVERWNSFAKVRIDLFSVIDIVSIDGLRITGWQTTSGSNHSARRKKILESSLAALWVKSGGLLKICSWTKKKHRWIHRIEDINQTTL